MLEPPNLELPARLALAEPAAFLSPVSRAPWCHVDIDKLDVVEMWVLVALCALSREQRPADERSDVYHRGNSAAGRFAHAVGFDNARRGEAPPTSVQPGRTVPIHRVSYGQSAEASARALANIVIPDPAEEESRVAFRYVLDELLRNVLQHSGDRLGAVVGAQRMDAGKGGYSRPTIQLAVADCGRGILESLRRSHTIEDPVEALEKSLRPHVSGTFPEGQTGGADNAGLGLFFTSEITKLTAGRLLLASRGAGLFLEGNEEDNTHRLTVLEPPGTGFPGTLAVFELPIEIQDGDAMLDVIRNRAQERVATKSQRRCLVFEGATVVVERFVVTDLGEGTDVAQRLSEQIRAALASARPVTVDFAGVRIATQSYLHALLFHPIRIAWAMSVPIYIANAEPAVRSGLLFLEGYAL